MKYSVKFVIALESLYCHQYSRFTVMQVFVRHGRARTGFIRCPHSRPYYHSEYINARALKSNLLLDEELGISKLCLMLVNGFPDYERSSSHLQPSIPKIIIVKNHSYQGYLIFSIVMKKLFFEKITTQLDFNNWISRLLYRSNSNILEHIFASENKDWAISAAKTIKRRNYKKNWC